MSPKPIHLYVAFVWLLAFLCLPLLDWQGFYSLPPAEIGGFVALILLGLLSESLALPFSVGKGARSSTTITFIPGLACLLLFGPAAAVVFLGSATAIGEVFFRRKPLLKASFNVAQRLVSASIAGLVFSAIGGYAIVAEQLNPVPTEFDPQLGPFFAFGALLLGLNHLLVTPAIALSQSLPLKEVLSLSMGSSGGNLLYDLLVSPLAIAIAFLYSVLGLPGLLLILLPLLFIRHSYLTNFRLQQANRDLLRALVKAIETRDPYTSGHSVRVAAFAKRMAQQLGLGSRRAGAIETAALLHDIGKIEVVYSDILKKPGDLTAEERAIIESHTIKGEQLLKSLSSFKSDITGAVRHHHERVDGKGYPDGLVGDDIPLGARIIKVCDAIDAMLSDRPYRSALPISAVREQLSLHSGTQFDDTVVGAIVSNGLLVEYAAQMESAGPREGVSKPSAASALEVGVG